MCKIVHFRKDPYDIYIGRPSKFSNPYSSKPGTLAKYKVNSREESLLKFEEYLLNNKNLMDSLYELKYKTLGCFCKNKLKPGQKNATGKSCHGDIIKKYVDKLEALDNSLF